MRGKDFMVSYLLFLQSLYFTPISSSVITNLTTRNYTENETSNEILIINNSNEYNVHVVTPTENFNSTIDNNHLFGSDNLNRSEILPVSNNPPVNDNFSDFSNEQYRENATELFSNATTNNKTEVNVSTDKAEILVSKDNVLMNNHFLPEESQNKNSSNQRKNASRNENVEVPSPQATEGFNSAIHKENIQRKVFESLMQIFELHSKIDRTPTTSPPEFMVDLYNTITDSNGITKAKNPFNAHIVRSLAERNNSINDHFVFKIPKLESWETILEAELHIHRMPTPYDQLHPSLYLTPFYILSLYQVVDRKLLSIPDLHKLLGVHYVPALGSGWEIFNVKQPVLKWMEEEDENNGFLVAAASLGGDRVPVRFARRGETVNSSKQPILVLFTEDSRMKTVMNETAKSSKKSSYTITAKTSSSLNSTQIQSEEVETQNIPTSSLENPRFHHALLFKDTIRHPNSVNRFRSRRQKNNGNEMIADFQPQLKSCGRHDLLVNFEAVGWSTSIISPKGYNAFYCKGSCVFPIETEMKPSNHAVVQSIVHQLNLSPGLGRPCCVPTSLLPISLLYYEDADTVVLKQYSDMVADTCGCL